MDWVTTIIFLIVIGWLCGLTYYLFRMGIHYQRLTKNTGKETLEEILNKILEHSDKNQTEINSLSGKLERLIKEGVNHIQKVGLVRFNPFEDTGGDQSFVLAVMDGKDTGIVLTSLHNRGITRWYAKKIKEGKGFEHELSAEEIKAIKIAQENNK